ncbi:MAG: SH3 domain-containing protein [Anaerolineae bacterium]|jgi:hypothetical protein
MTHDQQPDDNWEWESPERRRPKRLEEETAEVGFPIVWVLIGGLAGLLTIGLIGLGVVQLINKQSVPTATPPGLPTLALPATPTAAAVAIETATPLAATPTQAPTAVVVQPTDTPEPVAPSEIQIGGYVQIVNTEGAGLSLRAGSGTNNARLTVADEGAVLPVIDGPKEDEEGQTDEQGNVYLWWYLRNTDGTEGWGRADFLSPALPPE